MNLLYTTTANTSKREKLILFKTKVVTNIKGSIKFRVPGKRGGGINYIFLKGIFILNKRGTRNVRKFKICIRTN